MPFKYLFCVLIICEISCWAIMTLSIDCTVNITAKRIFLSNAQFKSKSHKNSCNWNIDSVRNQWLCTGSLGNHLKRNQRRHTNRFQLFIVCIMGYLYIIGWILLSVFTCQFIATSTVNWCNSIARPWCIRHHCITGKELSSFSNMQIIKG